MSFIIFEVTCKTFGVLAFPYLRAQLILLILLPFLHLLTFYFRINSEDGRLSCGYASFRGKRASMEDFYDIKATKIDGQPVCLFGIFDGQLLS